MEIPGLAVCGKSRWQVRVSPTLLVIREVFSEHIIKQQQEPKLTAFVSQDPKMIEAFQQGRDIYATIAGLAFGLPYEKCLEFHPESGEYQPDGKARRGEAKTIVLGITYGRSVVTIAEQLFGSDESLSDEEKVAKAQKVYDSVLDAFPNLRALMDTAQSHARRYGYVTTILGRRRHIPDMQLKPFEFHAMSGYVNPDVDPLDVSTLVNREEIPERIVRQLEDEFSKYRYFGQIARRTKELQEQRIRVVNNRSKINDASRQCVNCVDFDTEILTVDGWKRYDEIHEGDSILSYSMTDHCIVSDSIEAIHISNQLSPVVRFDSPTFSAVSTLDHRWVVGEADEIPRIKTTRDINRTKWPDYPILRVADNQFREDEDLTDAQLKILGWFFTDGNRGGPHYAIHLYQSTRRQKNAEVYADMIATLSAAGVEVTDACRDGLYHEIYLKQTTFTAWIWHTFPDRCLTFDLVSRLSQRQADVLMRAMLQGDGSGVDGSGQFLRNSRVSLVCKSKSMADAFQYLCFRAGYASNSYYIDAENRDNPSDHKLYASMSNIPKVTVGYYDVCVLRVNRAQIYPHHKHQEVASGVWCVTTSQGTWIARREGKVYITGNSIIQGSAAEQTKMALLLIANDLEWKRIGGRILVPVHDEIIAEVPEEYAEEGAKILSGLMCKAADFLPYPSKCDVETTYRWYGLAYPCKYPQPSSYDLDSMSPEEIQWVQYHLVESEYLLPVYKDKNGEKPRGDAAKGVNGRISDEMIAAVKAYCNRYSITEQEFILHIKTTVEKGVVPQK